MTHLTTLLLIALTIRTMLIGLLLMYLTLVSVGLKVWSYRMRLSHVSGQVVSIRGNAIAMREMPVEEVLLKLQCWWGTRRFLDENMGQDHQFVQMGHLAMVRSWFHLSTVLRTYRNADRWDWFIDPPNTTADLGQGSSDGGATCIVWTCNSARCY